MYTTTPYEIGKTYNETDNTRTTPNGKTTVNDIRNVLEKAGYHQRVLEVSSTDVTVNGSTITLKFPNGLTSDSDLSGRNWEILMEREAFMDEAGNYFADSQTVGNLVMKDNGTYAPTLDNYSFRNSSLNSDPLVKDENLVLLQVGDSYNFNSAGVAKPVIRVDKYSYGHEFYQPTNNGTMEKIDAALTTLNTVRGNLGAYQNRLEYTLNSLAASEENLTAAESRIRDTDMAKEMMNYTKMNVLTQAAQAMLAQANQQPQAVLQLLQ